MAILCKYTYDPLDRVSTLTPLAQAVSNRFYNGEQLMSELQGDRQRTCIRAGGQLLAQQSREGEEVVTTMIASDLHNSVLHASEDGRQIDIVYTPFGHHQAEQAIAELPGFNGERPDPVTGHYLLGNGYRAYNPVLMRFNSPDSLSPFGEGGLNAYAYGLNNPIKYIDPTGHFSSLVTGLTGILAALSFLAGGLSIYLSTRVKESNPTFSEVSMGVGIALAVVGVGFALSSIVMKAAGRRAALSKLDNLEKKYNKALTELAVDKRLIRSLTQRADDYLFELRRQTVDSEHKTLRAYKQGYDRGRNLGGAESLTPSTPYETFRERFKVDKYSGVFPRQGGPRNPLATIRSSIRDS